MAELRCDRHMHARVIPNATILEIKCSQCSRKDRPVFHYWLVADGDVRRISLEMDCDDAHDQQAS